MDTLGNFQTQKVHSKMVFIAILKRDSTSEKGLKVK